MGSLSTGTWATRVSCGHLHSHQSMQHGDKKSYEMFIYYALVTNSSQLSDIFLANSNNVTEDLGSHFELEKKKGKWMILIG